MPIQLQVGQTINNDQLCELFGCSPQGGMRRSLATGTLVIVQDHTRSIYEDRWEGDILHYTGMGRIGDQTLDGNQNRTLFESRTNGVEVHFFEVMRQD